MQEQIDIGLKSGTSSKPLTRSLAKHGVRRVSAACCVTSIELSGQAEIDLTEIYFYSLHAFGVTQADLYVRDLKKVC